MLSTIPISSPSAAAQSTPDSSRPEGRAVGSIVAIGGGSGLAVLLRGLKRPVAERRLASLAAVVTVADDGGSSGRLRRELGVLPPGDIRNCIVALSDDEHLLARLFQYRFAEGAGLEGHSFGNLFLTALAGITGDFYQAVVEVERILSVRGRILPATLSDVRLRARGESGRNYQGESAIGASGERLVEVAMEPADPPAFPGALDALRHADLIVLGPGSLYTSILPNLLIPGIRQAVRESPAPVVLLLNLMTQPGETEGMDAAAHLEVVQGALGLGGVDYLLVNSTPLPPAAVAHYREEGAEPVHVDHAALDHLGVELVETDLLGTGEVLRHDPEKLARAVLALCWPKAGERPGETG